jgi:hypothetical protein
MSSDLTPPEPSASDRIHTAIRAGVSAVPVVGGPAVELLNALIPPPLARRQAEWAERVAAALDELHRVDPERYIRLQEDEGFISVVLHATQAALRASRLEKRQLLASAVENSASGSPLPTDYQTLFIRYLDELPLLHILVLRLFAEHGNEIGRTESYADLLQLTCTYVDVRLTRDQFRLLCDDLTRRTLLRISVGMREDDDVVSGMYISSNGSDSAPFVRVTDIGHKFLDFVDAEALDSENAIR